MKRFYENNVFCDKIHSETVKIKVVPIIHIPSLKL